MNSPNLLCSCFFPDKLCDFNHSTKTRQRNMPKRAEDEDLIVLYVFLFYRVTVCYGPVDVPPASTVTAKVGPCLLTWVQQYEASVLGAPCYALELCSSSELISKVSQSREGAID